MKKLFHILWGCLIIGLFCGLVALLNTSKASAASWEAGYIIDDSKFTNNSSMTAGMIQSFFESKNSVCLTNYNGNGWAANVIKQEADNYNISPQVLIATLQKETSLVTTQSCDDWKYRTAMGFGCPDTAPCDAQYFGFQNQMHQAARHFRGFFDQSPGWFIPFTPGNRFISWSPNGACGGTNVNIINRATASLYSYTPYQPNAAAIAAGYGSGDGCSAYGNRNFWLFYNDWFGPSKGEGFVLAIADNGDPRQWVIHNGIRQHVASAEIINAWGLDDVSLVTLDDQYLGSFPEGPQLGRLMRPNTSSDIYFVDGGKCYKVSSAEMMAAWGFSAAAVSNVTIDLSRVPTNAGNLKYSLKKNSAADNYLVDGGTLRRYSSDNIFAAWEGDTTTSTPISDDYFNAMPSGTEINSTKVSAGSGQTEYQVVAGQKLAQSADVAALYPGSAVPGITAATINRLITSAPASQFIRAYNSGTVYMVDGGTKHAVSSIEVLRAWGVGVSPLVNVVTPGNLDVLTTGTPLNSFQADVSGQLYLMDGRKIVVSSSLDSAYRKSGQVFSASQSLLNLSPTAAAATNFIKGFNTPAVYLMDSTTLRNIGSPNQLNLWNGASSVISVSEYVLDQFGAPGSGVGAHISDSSGNEYVIESGILHRVSPSVKTQWQLGSPVVLAAATIARWPVGADLSTGMQNPGHFYIVIKGVAYMSVDTNIASVWSLDPAMAPIVNSGLVQEFLPINMLTRFVRSSTDTRLFIVDGQTLYHLSPEHAGNFGIGSTTPMMSLDPSGLSSATWSSAVVSNSGLGSFVIDGGGKRSFPNVTVQNWWTSGASVPSVTSGFINLLPNLGIVDRAIKGSGPNVYDVHPDRGVISKHWISSGATFSSSYGRFEQVSDLLLNALANGSNIP